ncbi:Succinate dehydrogenase cytochrome b558 subunit [Phycisphaerales bacterium]|nr:Succinate dehydrogenase cytochrome b558 subunit [Phycisphaerales bacterium]
MNTPDQTPKSFLDRHHFLFRRLHSLTGILPIGLFLIAHLTTNSSILWGKFALRGRHPDLDFRQGGVAYFWEEVVWLNEQIPHLLLVEIVLWASILFHAVLGVIYARSGRNNVPAYAYGGNRRYALQRLSGYVGIFFIFYHVATLRWGWSFLVPPFDGSVQWSQQASASTLAAALRGGMDGISFWGLMVSAFYFAGVSLLVFHFANGLWTAAITWGLTISKAAQQRWGVVCAAVGVGLMGMAWASVVSFATLDPAQAAGTEAHLAAPAVPPLPAPATPPTQASAAHP